MMYLLLPKSSAQLKTRAMMSLHILLKLLCLPIRMQNLNNVAPGEPDMSKLYTKAFEG